MKKKSDEKVIDDKTRQKARRDFIKKVGSASVAAGAVVLTGDALLPQVTKRVHAQTAERQAGKVGVEFVRQGSQPVAAVDAGTGVVVPNAAAIRAVIAHLNDNLMQDAALKKEFSANPRLVLGGLGLNSEVQDEILKGTAGLRNVQQAASRKWCICTGCCITSCGKTIVIG